MQIEYFETPENFRHWLNENFQKETELFVGFYKVGSGKPSISWSESVDQALCFGWIDGVRKSIDNERYCIRFTPRRKTSIWSAVNIKKMEDLFAAGLMRQEGLTAFSHHSQNKLSIYSHESEIKSLSPEFEERFKQIKGSWTFFSNQPPSYRKVIIHWIMSAKQEKTQISRLEKTIFASAKNERLNKR